MPTWTGACYRLLFGKPSEKKSRWFIQSNIGSAFAAWPVRLRFSPFHGQDAALTRFIDFLLAVFPDVHILATKEYYNRLSLYLSRDSALCARLSCGGVIETCRAVWENRIRNAFAIVRYASVYSFYLPDLSETCLLLPQPTWTSCRT